MQFLEASGSDGSPECATSSSALLAPMAVPLLVAFAGQGQCYRHEIESGWSVAELEELDAAPTHTLLLAFSQAARSVPEICATQTARFHAFTSTVPAVNATAFLGHSQGGVNALIADTMFDGMSSSVARCVAIVC